MNHHSLITLEFDRIRTNVRNLCRSPYGERRVASRGFFADTDELRAHREYSAALTDLLRMPVDLGLESIPEIGSVLKDLAPEGSTGEADELGLVTAFVRSYGALRRALRLLLEDYEAPARVENAIRNLEDLRELQKRLEEYLIPGGGLKDDIPRLRKLRDALFELDRRRRTTAEAIVGARRDDYRAEVPAARDGRLVLPLAAGKKTDGIVHGSSATGHTVFVEPPALLAANNAYVEGENALQREIHAILRELSDVVRGHTPELSAAEDRAGMWDEYLAQAAYGIRLRGSFAEIIPEGSGPVLSRARHPLLGDEAVPIDLAFGEGVRVIVLTGVNAGGKTVAMKTLGLLALMNQWGLPIPASPTSRLPLFDDVFIDSGDEQSIDGHLSTFSGHMKRVGDILESMNGGCLVLLDELGTGTDPDEGGALGHAILERVVEAGCTAMITTHLQPLKEFALSSVGVGSASMEFNESDMRATYRVLTGIPGESRALDIALASGLDSEIVNRARQLRAKGESDVSGFIRKYQALIRENEERAAELDAREGAAQERESRLEGAREDLEQRERELQEERARGLSEFLAESRRELEGVVKTIRERGADEDSRRAARDFRRKLEERAERERAAAESQEKSAGRNSPRPARLLERGDRVRWRRENREGTVLRKGRGDEWEIQFGVLRRSVPAGELEPVEPVDAPSVQVNRGDVSSADPEIDVRGLRLEDAVDRVRRHLDSAVASGLTSVRIIHGVGEGILARGIADCLDSEPLVSGHRFAPQSLGGAGATIADLQSPS